MEGSVLRVGEAYGVLVAVGGRGEGIAAEVPAAVGEGVAVTTAVVELVCGVSVAGAADGLGEATGVNVARYGGLFSRPTRASVPTLSTT